MLKQERKVLSLPKKQEPVPEVEPVAKVKKPFVILPNKKPKADKARHRWINKHSAWESDDCLRWPHVNSKEFFYLFGETQYDYFSRIMCEKAHGPRPTEHHQPAHTCGFGGNFLRCMNPRHMRWELPLQKPAGCALPPPEHLCAPQK